MPVSSSRSRWKFSFGRAPSSSSCSSSSAPPSPSPSTSSSSIPMSFICPISSSLMFDPVIVPTGHTFERACIEACIHLNFTPPPLSSSPRSVSPSSPSFFLIPNAALRGAIADFCDRASMPLPPPLSPRSARALVQDLIGSSARLEEREEAAAAAEEATDSPSETLKNRKNPPRFSPSPSTSSSSSSSASSFSSSEMIATPTASTSSSSDESRTPKSSSEASEEASILAKLKSPQLPVKESGLRALRRSTRESSELRLSLCTPRLLQALVPMIGSKSPSARADSTAVIVNLSIEPPNKVKIVRSGAVPPLIEALKPSSPSAEARDNAAGALFSLALDDENKLAIGVLGAIPPLVSLFASGNAEAGMALYHLSLAPNNLVKIAKMPGAVRAVLSTAAGARGGDGGRVGLMVLASLARRSEGRVALMDAGAVGSVVAMMEEEGMMKEEERHCLAALMYEMSRGSLRFRALARAAGAERALTGVLERGEEAAAREMARRTLGVVRGGDEEVSGDDEEGDARGGVVSDGLVAPFRGICGDFGGSSACSPADF